MQIGLVFPQTEIGTDIGLIQEYAQTAEALGYSHLLAYEHVVGVDVRQYPNWTGPYTSTHQFWEPFVLFSYLAAVTQRLHFIPGVIIMPQRQTVLVAKQAATLDVLAGGRLRIGVGVGWNWVEYIALNEDFHTRGRRLDEQIHVLRLLWTNDIVNFEGRWHKLPGVGINPLPIQRPIPIWVGGMSEAARRRAARLGDGWLPQIRPGEQLQAMVHELRSWIQEAGRDPETFGIEGRISLSQVPLEQLPDELAAWRQLGATHVGINLMGLGLSPREHLAMIQTVARAIDLGGTA